MSKSVPHLCISCKQEWIHRNCNWTKEDREMAGSRGLDKCPNCEEEREPHEPWSYVDTFLDYARKVRS